MFDIIQHPDSISECRENIERLLSLIKQIRVDIPERLLNSQATEGLLKRDKQTIYSLLYFLKAAYPEVVPLHADIAVYSNQ